MLWRSSDCASNPTNTALDSRKLLQTAIADQLTGPHFDTWLDSTRFQADRLVTQTRRLWYYSTLLLPGALGTEREFSVSQMEQLGACFNPSIQRHSKIQVGIQASPALLLGFPTGVTRDVLPASAFR